MRCNFSQLGIWDNDCTLKMSRSPSFLTEFSAAVRRNRWFFQALLSEPHSGSQKRHQERVRHFRPRRELRLEQGCDEEAMIGQFHGPGFPHDSSRTDTQTRSLQLPFILLIYSVITVVLLRAILASANRVEERARQNLQPLVTGSLGAALAPVRQGARKRCDNTMLRSGVVLR